jgi:hypothetical protein
VCKWGEPDAKTVESSLYRRQTEESDVMKHVVASIVVCLLLGTCRHVMADEAAAVAPEGKAAMEKAHAAVMSKSLFACPDCHTTAMEAGKCAKCGKDMKEMHVLAVKDGKAMLCACGADCKCDAKSMKDGKCSCGKDVTEANLSGMYVCPAGCPVISAKAGACGGCGKELKKVE